MKSDYQVISVEKFFTLGLQYSAFYPDSDHRNVVRRFYDLLVNCPTRYQLNSAIALVKAQYSPQFDLIKRICWHHLNQTQKSRVFSLLSA